MPSTMPERGRLSVEVRGTWRGATLSGRAVMRLTEEGLDLALRPSVAIGWLQLEGVDWRGGALRLHAASDVVTLTGPELERQAADVLRLAVAVPEWTAPLRALGSRRGGDVERQGRFFAPFLQARRRLEEEPAIEWRLDAFDAPMLADRVRGVVAALARVGGGDDTPHRRALEAVLLDEVEPLFATLEALGEAAAAVRAAPDATRLVAWRAWAARAGDVFRAADRCWLDVERVLVAREPVAAPEPGRAGRLRRLLPRRRVR